MNKEELFKEIDDLFKTNEYKFILIQAYELVKLVKKDEYFKEDYIDKHIDEIHIFNEEKEVRFLVENNQFYKIEINKNEKEIKEETLLTDGRILVVYDQYEYKELNSKDDECPSNIIYIKNYRLGGVYNG